MKADRPAASKNHAIGSRYQRSVAIHIETVHTFEDHADSPEVASRSHHPVVFDPFLGLTKDEVNAGVHATVSHRRILRDTGHPAGRVSATEVVRLGDEFLHALNPYAWANARQFHANDGMSGTAFRCQSEGRSLTRDKENRLPHP